MIYPGGVDFRSYSPLAHLIASRGYRVVLLQMPLNLPFFNVEGADAVIDNYPGTQHWLVGGHSLGGVVASLYATDHPELSGLVLFAAYPADDSLSNSRLKVLSIRGSLDGLVTAEDIATSVGRLPEHTRFLMVEGGNHAQFGSYGEQSGDGVATIDPQAQWSLVQQATLELLETISN